MVALVTLDRVKEALRIDTDDDDDLLEQMLIPAASKQIIRHLKSRAEEYLDLDSGGELVSGAEVPADIEAATVFLVGYWYRNPDSDPDKDYEGDELPRQVKAMLKMLRDPALA